LQIGLKFMFCANKIQFVKIRCKIILNIVGVKRDTDHDIKKLLDSKSPQYQARIFVCVTLVISPYSHVPDA